MAEDTAQHGMSQGRGRVKHGRDSFWQDRGTTEAWHERVGQGSPWHGIKGWGEVLHGMA